MAAGSLADEVARVAREQLAEFGGLDETHPKLARQIRRYWEEIGLSFPGVGEAWSAVFVSWCIKQAGASASEFKFSSLHAAYVNQAIKNADNGTGVFRAVPIDKEPVAVGDLIHRNRQGGRITYDQARRSASYPSHCDIVVAVRPEVAEVIGGNLSNTRAMKTVGLTRDGFVKQRSDDPYICVVKNLKGAAAAVSGLEDDEPMATIIKADDSSDHQLWLYAGGQRRKLRSPQEITELRKHGLLDNRETKLSRETLERIPVMPGAQG